MMYKNLMSRVLLLFCCFGLLTVSVYANVPAPLSVKVGIENVYKNGLWTPITIEASAPIKTLAIRSSDSDGTAVTYQYEIGKSNPAPSKTTVLAKLGRKNKPIHVSVNNAEFQPFAVPPAVNSERPIYLIFGSGDMGLQGAVADLSLREDRRPLLVPVKSLADLPDKWFGYEAVEMVVLTTSDPKLFGGLTAESPQMQAMNEWLNLGGKMLLCAGQHSGQFLGDDHGFLNLFLPGRFAEMTEMRSGTPFELFVNSKRQIFMDGTDDAPFMKMPRFTNPKGIVLMKDGDLPLVLRCAHGLGTLIYFGGDLSERPISNWRDRSALVRNVMQWNTETRTAVDPRSGAMLQLGYSDFSGQIRSALDKFDRVRIVPFSIILIILTAYWLIVGLFDWFFVHKVLKRPLLTWITFPFWIVLFSVLTYVLAAQGRPAEQMRNQLTVHDFDAETRRQRISTWFNEYSPNDQYDHYGDLDDDLGFAEETSGYFSWHGLPGSGLGGMAPKTVSLPVWQIGSVQKSYDELINVPIQTRSSKSFFGQHTTIAAADDRGITAQLADEEGIPIGTITVAEKMFNSMKNSILVYGRWVLELGEIQSGQTLKLTKTTPRRELRELLIPPKALAEIDLRGSATYNPQSTDLEYIVRVMSLYRVLGGYDATGLHHAFQSSLDLSGLLSADRVLLLGIVKNKERASADGKTVSATSIFRYSFPIKLTALSPRLNIERQEILPDELEEKFRPGFINNPSSDRK